MGNGKLVWSDEQYDWFYAGGYLYFVKRMERRTTLTNEQRKKAWLVTFLLALTVGLEVAALTGFILVMLAGGV